MNISGITSRVSKYANKAKDFVGVNLDKFANKVGGTVDNVLENDKFSKKVLKAYQPVGSNNSFLGLATIMLTGAIIPRVITASKRNPNDKEATKDEIQEILFRDVQTVGIILFALKILNTIVSAGATAKTGIPMTNKAFQKVFTFVKEDGIIKNLKKNASDFIKYPKEKFSKIGKNILDIIHPTGGNIAMDKISAIATYSNFKTPEEVIACFKQMDKQGGNSKRAYKTFQKAYEKKCLQQIDDLKKNCAFKFSNLESKINEILNSVDRVKNLDYNDFINNKNTNGAIDDIVNHIKDSDNVLVDKASGVTGWLRMGALVLECAYLGFGLPALNQKRLEKKYLKNNKQENLDTFVQAQVLETPKESAIPKGVKPQEVKLFNKFLK